MCCVACTSEQNSKVNINVVRADSLLNQVLALYEVKEYGLLLENYPPKENERATYLAGNQSKSLLSLAVFRYGIRLCFAV